MNGEAILRHLRPVLTTTAALLVLSACGDPAEVVQRSAEPPAEAAGASSEVDGASDTTPEPTVPEHPEGPRTGPGAPPSGKGSVDEDARGGEAAAEEPQLAVDDPARITTIPEDFRSVMDGTTWEPGCPVQIDELRSLTIRYVDLDGAEEEGELIVHGDVAKDLLGVFAQLYEDGFRIARIDPIEHFDGDDDASMAANNTSAFNCRAITGSDRWSEHAYGSAVDINPVQNPYARDGEVLPPEGEPYLDRDDVRPGMVTRPGVVEHFDAIGWGWGGDWESLKDYMHFSSTGR